MSHPKHRKPPLRGPRPYKGRCFMASVDDYVVIDIETTGLAAGLSEIIELGAVKVKGGVIAEEFATLVKPQGIISDFITQLTGITNGMVQNAPVIKDALPGYLEFIGDALAVGHNVHFDVNFIYDNSVTWLNLPFTNNFIDTMRLSRKLYKEVKGHKLGDLAARFGIPDNGMAAHRALADVIKTHHCYEYMKRAAKSDPLLNKRLKDQKLFPAHKQLAFDFA